MRTRGLVSVLDSSELWAGKEEKGRSKSSEKIVTDFIKGEGQLADLNFISFR